MGRSTNYEKLLHINEPVTYEKAKEKFGKAPMNSEEFVAYLSHYKYKNTSENITISSRTLRNYIDRLCELSKGRLKADDFKKGRSYCFKPEYHALLLTILNTDYFGENLSDDTLNDRTLLHKQLVDNVNTYLSQEDRDFIRGNPVYLNAVLEGKLKSLIDIELKRVLHSMYNFDPRLRYQAMIEVLDALEKLRRWMDEWQATLDQYRLLYADNSEELYDAYEKRGKFEDVLIDDMLIKMLEDKIHGRKTEYIKDIEELPYPVAYTAAQINEMRGLDSNEIQKYFNELDKVIEDQEQYKRMMAKVKSIFNEDDNFERDMIDFIDKIVRCKMVAPYIHADDYEKMVRFTESIMTEDKEKIDEALDEIGSTGVDQAQMKKVMDIKDRVELKRAKVYQDRYRK